MAVSVDVATRAVFSLSLDADESGVGDWVDSTERTLSGAEVDDTGSGGALVALACAAVVIGVGGKCATCSL
jgi:hypothetical protein